MASSSDKRMPNILRSTPVVALVAVAVVIVTTLIAIAYARSIAVERAKAVVESQAEAVAEHGSQVFSVINRILDESIRDARARSDFLVTVNRLRTTPASERFSQVLVERISAFPYILQVDVLDRNGSLVISSRVPEDVDLLDQSGTPAFVRLGPQRGATVQDANYLWVADPLPARGSNRQSTVTIAKQIIDPSQRSDQQITGIATVTIDLGYFNRYYQISTPRITFDMHTVLVQADRNNRILASTFYDGQRSDTATNEPLARFPYFEKSVGFMPETGQERVLFRDTGSAYLGLKRLNPWPVVIGVAFPADQLFTDWAGSTSTLVLSTLIFIGFVSVLIHITLRERRNMRKVEQALEANRANLEYRVKRRTSELRAERDKAEIANKAKSVTMAHLSHELRTPLTSIMGFAETIRDKVFGDDLERYRQYAGYIHKAGDYMRLTIEDLLDLTKIETGKYKLREDKFHLGTLISDCVNTTRQRAQVKNIKIDSYLHGPDFKLYADQRAMRQIFLNLLSNAVKYNRRGGQVAINFGLDPSGGGATISVEDNGVGIHEEDLPTIMAPMTRGKSGEEESGTGLGLPIVKALIELHGGRITVTSEYGKGTTFYISLPEARVMDVEKV